MQECINTKRIAKNTLMLYLRQILVMLVSLYTVREVLNALGAEDYGIYNVVAGVVTMFGFLSGTMATASQRYFSFELGRGNLQELKKIFSVTFLIYVLLAGIVVILAETVGLWFICYRLAIPVARYRAAKLIYQCAVASLVFNIFAAPYLSCIIAYEQMSVYAYVSIVEATLKLLIVFLLKLFLYDKLVLYGLCLLGVSVITTLLYKIYCKKYFEECSFSFLWDAPMFKEIFFYAGWNLFGSAVGIVKNQSVNILLNQFFNPVVNAARGISAQVNSAAVSFSQGFSTALRPQIIKAFAAKNDEATLTAVFHGCKITFFLMYIVTLPSILEMPFIMKVWLKNPPELTILFTRLVLVDTLIDSISFPIMTLAQATGKISLYQSVVGSLLLMNLPVSAVLLYLGYPHYSVMIAAIVMTCIAFIVRLFIVKYLTVFPIRKFMSEVVFPSLLVVAVSSISSYFIGTRINMELFKFIISGVFSILITLILVFFISFNKNERGRIIAIIRRKMYAC